MSCFSNSLKLSQSGISSSSMLGLYKPRETSKNPEGLCCFILSYRNHISLAYVSIPALFWSIICCQGLSIYIHQMQTGHVLFVLFQRKKTKQNVFTDLQIWWKSIQIFCFRVLQCPTETPVYVFPSFTSLSSQTRGLSSLCRQFISCALQSCSA